MTTPSVDIAGEPVGEPIQIRGTVGIALGSGAAKGWAHIGVLRALAERGIQPDVVCGASMGAIVGAAYAADRLDAFEDWARELEWRRVVGYFDLAMRGGLIKARRVFEFFERELAGAQIEDLPRAFATVATDLHTGQEVWLRQGDLLESLRATIALPGLVTPARWDGRWVVDGGIVNPVPVSLCRALGADTVIAVDLNTTLLSRRLLQERDAAASTPPETEDVEPEIPDDAVPVDLDPQARGPESDSPSEPGGESEIELAELERSLGDRLNSAFRDIVEEVRGRLTSDTDADPEPSMPSLYEVTANTINIMQVRIGRSRMAGDPPELLVTPRMSDFGLLDFDRAGEAIAEGERAVERAWVAAFGGD